MQKQYEEDVHGIHKIVALAFIHPDNVINAFTDLSIHLDDTMLDYFEDNYIGRFRANGLRTRPLLNIGMFMNELKINRCELIIQQRPATDASVSI